MREKG
jgi:hypothetical protein